MSDGPVLGIDLGTTNSVVAVADGGQTRVLTDAEGRRMVPSVVSFLPEGGTVVGYEARERRLVDAANTVYAVKRLIGRPYQSPEVARARERFAFEIVANKHGGSVVKVARGTYALAEISAIVLREVRRLAEAALGETADRAVITVPANFNELQRSATKAAGKVAGLEVLRILNEPTAAALAYGYGAGQNERIAVYDLGGGTFDMTVLELDGDIFEVLATGGDTFLGGEDLDRAVAERMCEAFREAHGIDPRTDGQAFERLKAAAEWAKCQLSTEQVVELTVEEVVERRGKSLDLVFTLTRQELEDIARPWLERSFAVCQETMRASGLGVDGLDSVVLVGGSTRMPLCRRMVAEYFGREPRTDIDPDMVVAQGAAIHGFVLGGPRTAPRPLRVAPPPPPSVPRPSAPRPRQPAFAPDVQGVDAPPPPLPPPRPSSLPPPMPELPAPAVVMQPAVAVRSPRSTLDTTLDALAPTDDLRTEDDLDRLAPSAFALEDPFADLEPTGSMAPLDPLGLPGLDDAPAPPRPAPPAAPARHAPPPPPPPRPRTAKPSGPALAPAALPLPAKTVLAMPDRPPPLLMDVTPHSLGLETAGGFCKKLIVKNAPVPTEQTRSFTTARDDQDAVVVRICQGEAEQFDGNEVLGEVVLDQLPLRRRGELTIEVVFILDADGTLAVEARDAQTGRAQRTRIALRGGHDAAEIDAMRARQEAGR
jgi:molecular chaperone DnaK